MQMETQRELADLADDEKKHPAIEHALNVRKALAVSNYARFFKLYQDAPNSGKMLMEVFIDKHRILCLQRLAFASQTSSIELTRLHRLLAFDDEQ